MSLLKSLAGTTANAAGLGGRTTGSNVLLQVAVKPSSTNSELLTKSNSAERTREGVAFSAYTQGKQAITTISALVAATTANLKRGSHISVKDPDINDGDVFFADVAEKTDTSLKIQNLRGITGKRIASFTALSAGGGRASKTLTIVPANFVTIPNQKTCTLTFEETRGTIDEKQDDQDVVPLNRTFAQRRGWNVEFTRNVTAADADIITQLTNHFLETKDEPVMFRMLFNQDFRGWLGAGILDPQAFPASAGVDDIAEIGYRISAASFVFYSESLVD